MPKPHKHADADVVRWGGKREDYEAIHDLMDSSKQCCADNRHRVATHNIWFVHNILPRIFGSTIINSSGREVSVKDIGEYHLNDDFRGRFIPTLQDYIENMEMKDWMNNGMGECPSSNIKIEKFRKETIQKLLNGISND